MASVNNSPKGGPPQKGVPSQPIEKATPTLPSAFNGLIPATTDETHSISTRLTNDKKLKNP